MKETSNKTEKVFMESYEEFSDAIFRYTLFQTSNRDIAMDITQDTFIKTWQYLEKGAQVENIRAFLYRVAKNLIIDYRRKKKSSSLDQILETGVEFTEEENVMQVKEEDFEKEADRKQVLKTIEKIDEKYKEILLMRYIEEMSIKEIGDILDKSQNHVSVMIHRGVEKLKKLLKENE